MCCVMWLDNVLSFFYSWIYDPANKPPSGMCRSDGVTTKLYLHAKYNIKLGKRRREAGGKKD